MESRQVIGKAVSSAGVKSVAEGMDLSASMIYKWCESKKDRDACGAANPHQAV